MNGIGEQWCRGDDEEAAILDVSDGEASSGVKAQLNILSYQ